MENIKTHKMYKVSEDWLIGLLKEVENVEKSKGTRMEVFANASLQGYARSAKHILNNREFLINNGAELSFGDFALFNIIKT